MSSLKIHVVILKRYAMWSTDFTGKGLLTYKDILIYFLLLLLLFEKQIRNPPHQNKKNTHDLWSMIVMTFAPVM